MSSLRQIPSFATDQLLLVIEAINDKTRAEILSLLINFPMGEGLTAAEISRQIKKTIPSTLHQLEILYKAGLITSNMKRVESIGREIKHWIFLQTNSHLIFNFDLKEILCEHFLPMDLRKSYLDKLLSVHGKIKEEDLTSFDPKILSSIFQNVILKDKEKERRLAILSNQPAKFLLISALMDKVRQTIGDGININLFGDIFGVNKQLADLLINNILNSQEFYYDEQSSLIHVRLIQ